MGHHSISYSKYNIDIHPFKYNYYLNTISNYYAESYLVTKISYEKILFKIIDHYVTCKNKNSELYSEMIITINKFNKGIYKHIVSKSVTDKIFKKANIHICKLIKTLLYHKGAIRYLNSKKDLMSIVSISL